MEIALSPNMFGAQDSKKKMTCVPSCAMRKWLMCITHDSDRCHVPISDWSLIEAKIYPPHFSFSSFGWESLFKESVFVENVF